MSLFGPARSPRNSITSSAELARLLGASDRSTAGVLVNEDTATNISTVWACARIVAEDIGKLPFPVYKRTATGGKEEARTSPFWSLIHDRPFGGINTFGLTSQQFRELLMFWAQLRGNGYAFKNVVGTTVRELIPIHPNRVRLEVTDDYEVLYWVRMPGGKEVQHTRREIFHFMGPTLDGIRGVSIPTMARQSFGLTMALEEHAARLFGNASRPNGVLKTMGKIDPEYRERLKEEWEESHQGLANAHKVAVLEEGLEWQNTGMSAEDAQMLAERKFQVSEIARWFRISAVHKVGDMEHATYTNIEVQKDEHVSDTLNPWAVRWDDAMNQQVINTNQVFARMNLEGQLRGLTKDRYEAYASAINTGWMTPNEAREKEDMERAPGLDEFRVPLNTETPAAAAAAA